MTILSLRSGIARDIRARQFVIVDARMNDLIAPSLYDAFHRFDLLSNPEDARESITVDVAGPVCETGCFFACERQLGAHSTERLVRRSLEKRGVQAERIPAHLPVTFRAPLLVMTGFSS